MARLILEVLDAAGGVRSRTRVESLPFTIGRGYRNDVILDDPYVSETHVRLVSDGNGSVVAEDAGTENGMSRYVVQPEVRRALRASSRGEPVSRVVLESGLALRLGRTVLRFRDIDAAVPPALVETPHEDSELLAPLLAPLLVPSATIPLVVGALAACSVRIYLSTFQGTGGPGRGIGMSIMILVMIAVWAAAWALASRINRHQSHFREHLALACIAMLGFIAANTAGSIVGAIVPPFDTDTFMGLTAILGLLFVIIAHLSLATSMTVRKRRIVASLVVVATFGLVASMANSRGGGYSTRMRYQTALLPLSPRLLSAVSTERFFEKSNRLLTELDEAADR